MKCVLPVCVGLVIARLLLSVCFLLPRVLFLGSTEEQAMLVPEAAHEWIPTYLIDHQYS